MIFLKAFNDCYVSRLTSVKQWCFKALISLGIIACLASSASALDYIAGAKGGYFIWDPYIKDIGVREFEEMKKGDGVLYGPVFSVMFTQNLSFSLSGLYGKQSAQWMEEDSEYQGSDYVSGNYSFKVKRLDVDGALSYRLTDNLKIFGGYKYQYLKITIESVSFRRDITGADEELVSAVGKNKIKMPYNGPALGFGFSTPIGEKFFFATNLSFLYMWGKMDMDNGSYHYDSAVGTEKQDDGNNANFKLRTRGINFEPSIGASMGEGLPIFTLGIRFQWTQVRFIDPPSGSDLNNNWNNDYLYGIFVSVLQPF